MPNLTDSDAAGFEELRSDDEALHLSPLDRSHFSSEAYLEGDRENAWREALASASILSSDLPAHSRFFGLLTALRTPHHSDYLYLASRRQTFALANSESQTVLLILVIEGSGSVVQPPGQTLSFTAGDFIFGSQKQGAQFGFDGDFRALFLRVPRSILVPRLLAPAPSALELIPGQSGFAKVFGDLLGSVISNLSSLTLEQLRAIEATVVEFLATSVVSEGDVKMLGGVTGRRAGVLHRIAQTIERRLAEPEMSLADVAGENHMSVRNLQKLFETFDKTFSSYLRARRLERCKHDLSTPLLSQLSISEICYRWGFTDPAYFSRSFREAYGTSPRGFRKAPHLYQEQSDLRRRELRGRPARAEADFDRDESAGPGPLPTENRSKVASLETQSGPTEHWLPATSKTVHWGYFNRFLPPVIHAKSGDIVTIECLTHHAYDDYERMIAGDAGAEDVFHWTKDSKNVNRRGAGPIDASTFGRGAGEGFGVHICTGPVEVADARPGDILEVRILSTELRKSANPAFGGKSFGSNAAAFWGFHYHDMLTEPKAREVVTIYEVDACQCTAKAVYNFRWTPQTDPFGVVHSRIDYPGVPVDHTTIEKNFDVLKGVEIPVRPHFGVIGLAPDHAGLVDSVPPSYFGGNLDNWRIGAGSVVYLPVAVEGALLSIGDPHASQGDSESCGTAIECSLTGRFQLILHKRKDLAGEPFADLNYPLIETEDDWVISGFSHPNYLQELGQDAQSEVYKKSSIDLAMRDAFRKTRRFLMSTFQLSEDEAISLISVAVDFGITQVADGNWGVHAVIRKSMFDKRTGVT